MEALPQTYYSDLEQSFIYYVPNGFIVLKDPTNGSTKMVNKWLQRNLLRMFEEMTITRWNCEKRDCLQVTIIAVIMLINCKLINQIMQALKKRY